MRIVFWSAFWAFLVDQLSKYWVVHGLELSRVLAIDVVPPVLNFRYGENRGINFGLLDQSSELTRWALIILAVCIVGAVLFWINKAQTTRWGYVGAGLLIGG
ncbi:MAG: signal peptidase II, partial [Paracoccaceae bacterium]